MKAKGAASLLQTHGQRPVSQAQAWVIVALGVVAAIVVTVLVLGYEGRRGNGVISGQVMFEDRPSKGAQIEVYGCRACLAQTDGDGRFTVENVPTGPVTLVIRRGNLRSGYPIQIPPGAHVDVATLPLLRWRPLPGRERGFLVH